jgi:hypothetical protein
MRNFMGFYTLMDMAAASQTVFAPLAYRCWAVVSEWRGAQAYAAVGRQLKSLGGFCGAVRLPFEGMLRGSMALSMPSDTGLVPLGQTLAFEAHGFECHFYPACRH